MTAPLDGAVVDPDAAWLLDHVPAAMSISRRTFEEWLAIGERLAAVRDRIPSDKEYGQWCKQYNWFGSAQRKHNLSDAFNAFRFYSTNSREDLKTRSIQELSARQQKIDKLSKRAARQAIEAPAALDVDLRVGDFRDVLADVTCDVVLTDPPYPREYLPLYADLAKWADDILPAHGLLAVMVGESYLPELLNLMDGHRPYRWTMAYFMPGGLATQMWQRRVNTYWKPILIYGAVNEATPWIGYDVTKSDVNAEDKDHHEWGQSVSGMRDLVRRLSEPGHTICDPFMGAGTTGVAAALEGRHFVGCDLDPAHVATAAGRLA